MYKSLAQKIGCQPGIIAFAVNVLVVLIYVSRYLFNTTNGLFNTPTLSITLIITNRWLGVLTVVLWGLIGVAMGLHLLWFFLQATREAYLAWRIAQYRKLKKRQVVNDL